MKKLCLVLWLLVPPYLQGLKLDRVILSTNVNPRYIEFWPVVSKAWHDLLGIRPTLALISERRDIPIDTTYGDIIYCPPIPGIPTDWHARMIRLALPAFFENEVCLISDIDMIPLNRSFFVDHIREMASDTLVVYDNKSYDSNNSYENFTRIPMCYVAAKGSIFKEIFDIHNVSEIPNKLRKWLKDDALASSDEFLLTKSIKGWSCFRSKVVLLNYSLRTLPGHRRFYFSYSNRKKSVPGPKHNNELFKKGYYVDFHMHRLCFSESWRRIKQVTDAAGFKIDYDDVLKQIQLFKPYYQK